ncbi:MAG: PorV/PorQ family protein [candidate division WOR-3 bacterium]
MGYKILLSITISILISSAWLYEPGATGMTFLKLGIGARPVAMGNAFNAVSDDGNAIFWNPAGFGISRDFHLTGMGMNMLGFVNYFSLGSLIPVGRFGGIGVGASYLFAQDTRYSEMGEELGSFTNSDLLIGLGYAYPFISSLSGGASMKFIRSQLAEYSAYSFTTNVGIIFSPIKYIYLGSSIRDLGPPRRFISEWEYPPTNLRNGIALKIPIEESQITISSDLSVYPDVSPTFSAGGELALRLSQMMKKISGQPLSGIFIRCGYQSGYHLGNWGGLSFGLGIEYQVYTNLFLILDLVYFSYGYLGESERVSLSLRYAPSIARRSKSGKRPGRSRR